jgi:xanthine dehydrogenase YagT iron-sulfur-binding subunit
VPRYACLVLVPEAEGHEITTIEGLLDGEALGDVQQAFAESDALQCGYCTSGQIMSAEGLLRANPQPDVDQIRKAMSGNLCRCGAYVNVFKAVQQAGEARQRSGSGS